MRGTDHSSLFRRLLLVAVVAAACWPAPAAADLAPGSYVLDGSVWAVERGPDGSTYLGGEFKSQRRPTGSALLVGTSAAGAVDPAFPAVAGRVEAAVSDGSGGWYLGGSFSRVGGVPARNLAHVLSSGEVDRRWSVTPDGNVSALALHGTTLYAGGSFLSVDGANRARIASFDTATGALSTWNPGVSGSSVRVIRVAGSTVYIGGNIDFVAGEMRPGGAAFNANTGALTTWNPSASGWIEDIAVTGSSVLVAGYFETAGGQPRVGLAALNTGSGAALPFAPDIEGSVEAMAVDGSTVYIGGAFSAVGGQARQNLAALDLATGQPRAWSPAADGVSALALSGSTVYAGGRSSVAAFSVDTAARTAWDPSPAGAVNTLVAGGSRVVVGGDFAGAGPPLAEIRGVARIKPDGSLDTSWNPAPQPDPAVQTLALAGSTLYIGGKFTRIGGFDRNHLAAVNATTGAVTGWNPDAEWIANDIAVAGSVVYLGGEFDAMGGQPRSHLAAVNATTGALTAWNPGADARVDTLDLAGGTLYVGGIFNSVGGANRAGLAALNAGTGVATAWNPAPNGIGTRAIAAAGSNVYVAGSWTVIGGKSRTRLAAIDAGTGEATDWNPGPTGIVLDLEVSGSMVYAAGNYGLLAGQARRNLGAIDAATGALSAWNPSADNLLLGIAVEGTKVFAGGRQTAISGAVSGAFAALDASAPETRIDAGPGGLVGSRSATFAFAADHPGSTFVCSLDGGPFTDCRSPVSYQGLADGPHSFAVRATDGSDLADPSPATRAFTVDATPPETAIAAGPPFVLVSEVGATFECSLDGAAFAACASPFTPPSPSPGEHTLAVRATDAAGNTDPSPAVRAFTVAAPPTSPLPGVSELPPALPPATPSRNVTVRVRSGFQVPPAVAVKAACSGRMRLELRAGRTRLGTKTAALRRRGRTCRFEATFTIARSKLSKARTVTCRVRYRGTRVLGARSWTINVKVEL
jgi:hypothetical protein